MLNTKKTRPTGSKPTASNATKLRTFLALCLFLILGGGSGAYYLNMVELEEYAELVNAKVIDSEAAAGQVQQLQVLEDQVGQERNLISKATDIFATEKDFQSQAVRDVRHYAQITGLKVVSTTFSEDTSNSQTARLFGVEIESPVQYQNFIRFLKGIESNVPKMEVTKLKISRSASGGGNAVNIEELTMAIHVK